MPAAGKAQMSSKAAFDPVRFATPEEQERWFDALARTVAVDFDGVLHPYTEGWVGAVPADEPPMLGADAFLQQLRGQGYRIVVFSTRCEREDGLAGTRAWLEKWGLAPLIDDVTCQKPAAVAYVDDRAVPFVGDWSTVLAGVERLAAGRAHGAAPQAQPVVGLGDLVIAPPTWAELQALLPKAGIENSCAGEVVIYTGWAVNPDDPHGKLIEWCEECESGTDLLPGNQCPGCGRGAAQSAAEAADVIVATGA